MKKARTLQSPAPRSAARLVPLAIAVLLGTLDGRADAGLFIPGNLLVTRSVYSGDASTVTVGQTLPGGGLAIADGSYPNVFQNNTVDGGFGVTAPIFIDQITTSGTPVSTFALPPGLITTSFSSKSELAINLSTDGQSATFMGYASPINQLDVSNSNTPAIIEPGNPVTTTPTFREVAQIDANGNVQVTTTNAYSGNNGRAAILDSTNHQYLTVGNAGNGNGSAAVTAATGVQIVTPGQNATSETPGTTKVGNFNITQYGYPADKTAKDNNFRGETIFNNTLYVTKGSGGNGINTVYQVGQAGVLPTAATAANAPIIILPGFPTGLAKSASADHPFGIWFANANTLYVADEGDGVAANAKTTPHAGLEKWSLVGGIWTLDYTLQNGLNLGVSYGVPGLPASLDPATDGLRNITGKVNANGTVTIFGITSTVSASGDQGADPNRLVAITDNLSFLTAAQAANEQFSTLENAGYGEVLRGVSFAPVSVPEPSSLLLLASGCAFGLITLARRRRRA